MYTRSFSAGLFSREISSRTLAAAAGVKSIGRCRAWYPASLSGRPTISMRSGWGPAARGSSARTGTARRVGPRERLLHRAATRRCRAHGDPHRREPLGQHDVALHLLEIPERIFQRRRLLALAQVAPAELLVAAVAAALHHQGQPALAGLPAFQVLRQGGGEVPHLSLSRAKLQLVHGQAAALGGGADEAFIEGNFRAQRGHLLLALGQRALQLAVGLAADLVRARERGHALLELLHLLAQGRRVLARAAAKHGPHAPGAERQRKQHQREQAVDPVDVQLARPVFLCLAAGVAAGAKGIGGRFVLRRAVRGLAFAHWPMVAPVGDRETPARQPPGAQGFSRGARRPACMHTRRQRTEDRAAPGGPMSEAHLFAIGILLAWLAGIRAYLTVFGVGLAGALGWLDLP